MGFSILRVGRIVACALAIWACSGVSLAEKGDPTGPTVVLRTGQREPVVNPAADFMYFVPLISPVRVETVSSEENEQVTRILSLSRREDRDRFQIRCEFEMKGDGFHQNTYDPQAMLDKYGRDKKGKTLKNMLDFIRLEGRGEGCVEVVGRRDDGRQIVEKVSISFNENGSKSPVTIGLYNVRKKDGRFEYGNRYDERIVRVNTLSFKPAEDDPKMEVAIASIAGADEKEGFWSGFKGALANLFLPPVEVDEVGNQAMLDFGGALAGQQRTFTFPEAVNLIGGEAARRKSTEHPYISKR